MGHKLHRALSKRELVRGDSRMRNNFPGWTLREIQRHLLEIAFSPRLPPDTAHLLLTAKQLCVAGYFFYELFAVSMQRAATACDTALRHRYMETLPTTFTLSYTRRKARRTSELTIDPHQDPLRLFDALANGWRIDGRDRFHGSFGQLVNWGLTSGVIPPAHSQPWHYIVRLRNRMAHGSAMIVMPMHAISELQHVSWMLNPLFPDAATTAHDAKVQGARRRPDPLAQILLDLKE